MDYPIMAWKKILVFCLFFLATPFSHAESMNGFGQTVQIYTHFTKIIGKPTWLLEIYDIDSNQVLPYLFDITEQDNFWVAFSFGRNYRITASTVRFFPFPATIHNFCHLEDGILSGKSLYVTLSGPLTPARQSIQCHVMRYPNTQFTIAPSE